MNLNIIILCVVVLVTDINGERLHGQIYSSIEGSAACFRRLNGTHQMGCSSTDNGAVGVVHMIFDVADAEWIVHNSTAGPYVGVVSTSLFHSVIDLLISEPSNVAGILLYDNATMRPTAFSQESRCPNEYSAGPGSTCSSSQAGGIVWNDHGTGLLRRDVPFPIFFLPESKADEMVKIVKCYNKYNIDKTEQKGQPLCSLQLSSFMYAAVNSAVCLRRSASSAFLTPTKVCDPLGDYNVYYSLFPRVQETGVESKPVTLVTARIDSASMFDGIAPGAASSAVGMTTLIVAAATLSQMIPVNDSKLYARNVLWTLFNGESFDYIGSQRVAFDLSREMWPPVSPLSPSDIKLHIEIGQLGGALDAFKDNASWPMYAFAPYADGDAIPPEITEFLAEMSQSVTKHNFTIEPAFTKNLPPSSLHSFRKILQNETLSGKLPEVLLVDHMDTFTNMYYESALDVYDKIDYLYHNLSISTDGKFIPTEELLANGTMTQNEAQVKIARIATALAQTLYQQVAGKPYVGSVEASAHLVDEILYCLLQSQACRLISAADYASNTEEVTTEKAASLYVGVAAWANTPAVYAGHVLALLTGERVNTNRTACDALDTPGYSYYFLRGWNHTGVCIQTTMNFSQAVSPAFIKTDYDFSSGEYSTWTESVWQTMWVRVFVTAGGGGARLAAITGVFATLVAAVTTYWLQTYSHVIFPALSATLVADTAPGILRTVNC
ncbi:unnamed protein product [Colias eurytheme]|nr:unnamed protein product [Colias eurytheme]